MPKFRLPFVLRSTLDAVRNAAEIDREAAARAAVEAAEEKVALLRQLAEAGERLNDATERLETLRQEAADELLAELTDARAHFFATTQRSGGKHRPHPGARERLRGEGVLWAIDRSMFAVRRTLGVGSAGDRPAAGSSQPGAPPPPIELDGVADAVEPSSVSSSLEVRIEVDGMEVDGREVASLTRPGRGGLESLEAGG